jgi:hypothetical protein
VFFVHGHHLPMDFNLTTASAPAAFSYLSILRGCFKLHYNSSGNHYFYLAMHCLSPQPQRLPQQPESVLAMF